MRDFVDIGSSPPAEDCAQVGSDRYFDRARRECRAYIGLLRRSLGTEPEGAALSLRANPHDFGTYLSVVCYFETENQAAVDYAFKCESDGPENWDQQALEELASGTQSRKERQQ